MTTLKAIVRSLWIAASERFQQTFGRTCAIHDTWYRSELCPLCVRQRFIDEDTFDRRPAWTKSEGTWPLARDNGAAAIPADHNMRKASGGRVGDANRGL